MITGIIAFFILIVCIIPAISNGEWGSVAIGAVIALLVLYLGIISREDDRAFNNFTHYWATGERPGRKESRQVNLIRSNKVSEEEERKKAERKRLYDQEMQVIYAREEEGMKKYCERLTCPKCHTNTFMERTVIKYGGAEIWQIKCPECRETSMIRVK